MLSLRILRNVDQTTWAEEKYLNKRALADILNRDNFVLNY